MDLFGPTRPAGWLTAALLDEAPDTLFFHARDKLAATLHAGYFKLLLALAAYMLDLGWGLELLNFSAAAQDIAVANPRHLHIFMDDRPVYAANAIHSVPSYLNGYWFFDELGSRNNSLAHLALFDARRVDRIEARALHARLVEKFILPNRSRFAQAPRGAEPVQPGCLAFFSQNFRKPPYHRHFMTGTQMIEAAIAAKGDRPLYIKPHPNQPLDQVQVLTGYHDPANGVFVTSASIHDLLEAADCVLTLTSAVGFEAFLHRKPVILGGQTDYWQNAITLSDPSRLGAALDEALLRRWPHEKFLYWYLRQMCYEDSPDTLPRVLALLHRKGFTFADTGRGFF